MAITGNNDDLYKASLNMDANSYSQAVGKVQGETVSGQSDWADGDNTTSGALWWKKTNEGDRTAGNYNAGTVQGANGAYVLKGKAGITAQFYTKFSDAFDAYKKIIKDDLNDLETNPDIHQAFSGTEIEKAVKNLIVAVEAEANDYLFKLEQAEKTVINAVQSAFRKQQEKMGASMEADTSKLKQGNSSQTQKDEFAKKDVAWGGTPDGNSGSVPKPVNNVAAPTTNRNLTY